MIGVITKIKYMMHVYLFLSLLYCCNVKTMDQQPIIQIEIDSHNPGWYFIELNKDSLIIKDIDTLYVKFDSTTKLMTLTVGDPDNFNYKAIDRNRNDISDRLKLPGVLSHHSGRVFFEFYNPTEKELLEIKDWLPTNPNYFKIKDQANKQLDSLVKGT